jgi:hypothetical protein
MRCRSLALGRRQQLSRSSHTKCEERYLRVCIYFQLSMIIEQQLLLDFGLSISVPSRPPIRQITSSYAETFSPTPKYSGNLPGTFLSFIQKKGVGLFRSRKQSGPVASTPVRTGSLDISPTTNTSSPNLKEPRKRRISFMPTSPATLPVLQALQEPSKQYHFLTAFNRIQESGKYMSTCVGVQFHPPKLLEDLASREKATGREDKQIILKGSDKAGLRSIATGSSFDAGSLFIGAQCISLVVFKAR